MGGPQDGLVLDLPANLAQAWTRGARGLTVSLPRPHSHETIFDIYALDPGPPASPFRLRFVRTHHGPMEGAVG